MRFLPNPYYEPELRPLSGKNPKVRDFIAANGSFYWLIDNLKLQMDKLIPLFCQQDKKRLLIAFGCTGGRHRSVCAAETFYEIYKEKYNTKLIHRDADFEAEDIELRTGEREG